MRHFQAGCLRRNHAVHFGRGSAQQDISTITPAADPTTFRQHPRLRRFRWASPLTVPGICITVYTNQHRVFKVSSSGTLTVVAGNGFPGYSGDGGPATQAQLYNPQGVAVDHAGNVFIADESNCAVREVNAGTGNITTVAGVEAAGCTATMEIADRRPAPT